MAAPSGMPDRLLIPEKLYGRADEFELFGTCQRTVQFHRARNLYRQRDYHVAHS